MVPLLSVPHITLVFRARRSLKLYAQRLNSYYTMRQNHYVYVIEVKLKPPKINKVISNYKNTPGFSCLVFFLELFFKLTCQFIVENFGFQRDLM